MAKKVKEVLSRGKPFQTSKEYFNGKWQRVGFYGDEKNPTIRPLNKKKSKKSGDSDFVKSWKKKNNEPVGL